ncbi:MULTISPECIES: hypothetical protein [unclassified Rhodanobacter]|uniref:hypothetical protein n=1 Tax=unclassified Rhodanobacter TaxID=2621553 RepID=UPI001BE01656|nr:MULTISPECIES: hypothetical protein [unclassified Rhodanobacter]MBT2145302.1 hypothetical protein [Rhodanobacter sp. LX-99]MBT2149347.1 hypothetical protein [Rhodanobacter sp. LX-100]
MNWFTLLGFFTPFSLMIQKRPANWSTVKPHFHFDAFREREAALAGRLRGPQGVARIMRQAWQAMEKL